MTLAQQVTTLAHAGGWDEALFVVVPMALVVVLLRVGARKTPPDPEEQEPEPEQGDESGEQPGQQVT